MVIFKGDEGKGSVSEKSVKELLEDTKRVLEERITNRKRNREYMVKYRLLNPSYVLLCRGWAKDKRKRDKLVQEGSHNDKGGE